MIPEHLIQIAKLTDSELAKQALVGRTMCRCGDCFCCGCEAERVRREQEPALKPGWQICTVLKRARDKNGQTHFLQGSADALGFFEAIALAELEERWIRLPAPAQRHFFGKVLFGRRSVYVDKTGLVIVFRTCAFGHDWETDRLRYHQMRKCFIYDEPEAREYPL